MKFNFKKLVRIRCDCSKLTHEIFSFSLTALQQLQYSGSKALQFVPESPWAVYCTLQLLRATEIMTNTLHCWVGPRWEINISIYWRDSKNNLVDLCGLSVFPVHQVKPFSHLPSAPQFILTGRCFPAFHLSDWVFQHTTCIAHVPHITE